MERILRVRPFLSTIILYKLKVIDSSEQKNHFAENPIAYQHYCKQIESELNQRFKFILNGTPEAEGAKKVYRRLYFFIRSLIKLAN
jgi:hypothetical protein